MNCYAYLNENPISYIDPFGLSAYGDSWVTTGLSYGADAVPILGTVKGFQETITGVNYITGEQLSVADRVANGIGSLTGLIPFPGTKYIGKYGTEAAIDAGGWVVKQFGKNETKQVASKLPLKVNLQLFAKEIETPRTFFDDMDAAEASRYQRYWEQNINPNDKGNPNTRQRTYAVPSTRSIIDQKLSNTGELYKRETIYDQFGRRIGNNDYTNHGKPHHHESPHYHPNPWQNPTQHGPNNARLHPDTPRW